MCNRDNARDVAACPDKVRREVSRTNQVQTKINIVKVLQTSVIHSNEIFFKKDLLDETFSSDN